MLIKLETIWNWNSLSQNDFDNLKSQTLKGGMDASTINLKGYHDAKLGKTDIYLTSFLHHGYYQWVEEPRALYSKPTRTQFLKPQWPSRCVRTPDFPEFHLIQSLGHLQAESVQVRQR